MQHKNTSCVFPHLERRNFVMTLDDDDFKHFVKKTNKQVWVSKKRMRVGDEE